MVIGIISMQRVINYGSFLQAYALKSILEDLGHEVHFVDIKKGRRIIQKNNAPYHRIIIDKYFLKRIDHILFAKIRRYYFNRVYFPFVGISSPRKEEECDYLVIGSDEVFNCCNPTDWGFSLQLFGNTIKPSISYAASCGFTTVDDLEKYGINDEIKQSLKQMHSISVRDANTYEFVKLLTGIEPCLHLDPVLVYSWNNDIKSQSIFKNYIIIYSYDNRINDPNEIAAIKDFAKKHRKKTISCGLYQRWCDINILCSPFELLGYFDGADFVITDTFHGSVISINRNKQFATIIRDSNYNKIHDLLVRFHLSNHEVNDIRDLESCILSKIDYRSINDQLLCEKNNTLDYLYNCLKNED